MLAGFGSRTEPAARGPLVEHPRQQRSSDYPHGGPRAVSEAAGTLWRVRSSDVYLFGNFTLPTVAQGGNLAVGYIALAFYRVPFASRTLDVHSWRVSQRSDFMLPGFWVYSPVSDYIDFPSTRPSLLHVTLCWDSVTHAAYAARLFSMQAALAAWQGRFQELELSLTLENHKYWFIDFPWTASGGALFKELHWAKIDGDLGVPSGTTCCAMKAGADWNQPWMGLHMTWW